MPSRMFLTQMKLSIESVALRTIDVIIIPDHFVFSLNQFANKLKCESWRLFIRIRWIFHPNSVLFLFKLISLQSFND